LEDPHPPIISALSCLVSPICRISRVAELTPGAWACLDPNQPASAKKNSVTAVKPVLHQPDTFERAARPGIGDEMPLNA